MGQIFGGVVAYGIAVGARKHGSSIETWKIVFLVNGCLTAALGVVFFFIMPDSQLNARWLSPGDRILCIERVRANQQGIGNKHFKPYQLKEALLDPLTWAFAFYAITADIPNGGISNFFSQLIVSFGYTPEQSLLYGTPGGAVEVVALIASGYVGYYTNNRILTSMIGLTVALIGIILIVAVPIAHPGARLAGYYMTQASPTPFVALLALISSNIAGYTKKTSVAAIYLISYCAGNIIGECSYPPRKLIVKPPCFRGFHSPRSTIHNGTEKFLISVNLGPQTFRPKDAPAYRPAEITIIACYVACLLDLAFIYWYCRHQNSQKAQIRAQPDYQKLENQEFLDLTDKENPEFEYAL